MPLESTRTRGQEFLEALRRSSWSHSIPVLAISAHVETTATDLGVDAFLEKPLQLHALVSTVNSLILESA